MTSNFISSIHHELNSEIEERIQMKRKEDEFAQKGEEAPFFTIHHISPYLCSVLHSIESLVFILSQSNPKNNASVEIVVAKENTVNIKGLNVDFEQTAEEIQKKIGSSMSLKEVNAIIGIKNIKNLFEGKTETPFGKKFTYSLQKMEFGNIFQIKKEIFCNHDDEFPIGKIEYEASPFPLFAKNRI